MKLFILIGMLALFSKTALAQDVTNYTSEIRLQFGGSFPGGSFKSTDFEEDYPPFAMSGPLLQLSYNRSINQHWAAGGTFALRRNPFDTDNFADASDELVISRESEPWQSVFTLADVYYRLAGDNFEFYLKGSVGAAFSRRAGVTVTTTFGTIDHKTDRSAALAYGLHGGLKHHFGKWGLGLEAGIFSTQPTFEMTNAQGKKTSYKQTMATIDTSIFAAYSF